jgi:hypothetical protein
MGNVVNFKQLNANNHQSEYEHIGAPKVVNGVKGVIMRRRTDSGTHTKLPVYADSSDLYFRQNKSGVCQARLYINHKMFLDFDWSHNHNNYDAAGNIVQSFNRGTVHVQQWKEIEPGHFVRLNNNARGMNNYEIMKYGPILKSFCPDIKLR